MWVFSHLLTGTAPRKLVIGPPLSHPTPPRPKPTSLHCVSEQGERYSYYKKSGLHGAGVEFTPSIELESSATQSTLYFSIPTSNHHLHANFALFATVPHLLVLRLNTSLLLLREPPPFNDSHNLIKGLSAAVRKMEADLHVAEAEERIRHKIWKEKNGWKFIGRARGQANTARTGREE